MNPSAELPSSVTLIRLMGVVSLICGLLIVGTHLGTLDPIRRNQETILRETVAQLLPGVSRQVTYGVDASGELKILTGADSLGPRFFAGYDGSGELLGVVIEASERGYADVIRAMYAYSPEKEQIVDFRVLEMKETPGLGDKINSDSGFLANFRGLAARLDPSGKLEHAIVAVKHGTKKNPWEVDAISGATISSRAVGRMLDKSAAQMLPLVRRNLERIRRAE
ncbi:MAG: FMN-binding protein [Bryobacteraceae bacterium]